MELCSNLFKTAVCAPEQLIFDNLLNMPSRFVTNFLFGNNKVDAKRKTK